MSTHHHSDRHDGTPHSPLAKTIVALLVGIPIASAIAYGAVDSLALGILFIVAALIVVLWIGESIRSGELRYSSELIQLPLLGLIAIGCVQLLPITGADPSVPALATTPARTLSVEPYATRFFLIQLFVYFVFFAAALTFVPGGKRLKRTGVVVVIFGTALAFFGILQKLSMPEAIYGLRETPQAIPFGPFVNQHHFAALMEMTSGIALGLLLGTGIGRERKLFVALAAGIMGMAIVFTGSRGGLIGFVCVVAFAAAASLVGTGAKPRDEDERIDRRNRNMLIAAASGGLVILILGSVLFLGGQDSLFRSVGLQYAEGDITSGRLHFWDVALKIFFANPLLGTGLNSFGVAFTAFDTWNGRYRVENAHNDYLQMLADGGILGFACVVLFVFLLLRKGIASINSQTDGMRRSIIVGAMAGCIGILVHSFLDFPLRTPANAFVFLLLVAMIVGNFSVGRRRRTHSANEISEPSQ